MNKHKRIIISSVVVIVVIVGCFTIGNIVGSGKAKNGVNTGLIGALIPNVKSFYNVGETVKINSISMRSDKIEISNGIKIDRPDEGTDYLIVTITIINGSKSKIRYGDDFQIQDANGQINDSVVTMIDPDQTLRNGDLAPNGKVTGTITFLIVKGSTGLSLNYNGDLFGHSVVHFKLN